MVQMLIQNTDRELWREIPDDSYSPSIHVTQAGGIGIKVGGEVYIMPVREWHAMTERVRRLERAEKALLSAHHSVCTQENCNLAGDDWHDIAFADSALGET